MHRIRLAITVLILVAGIQLTLGAGLEAVAQEVDQELSISKKLAGRNVSAELAAHPRGLVAVWRNVEDNGASSIYAAFVKRARNGHLRAKKVRAIASSDDTVLHPTIAYDQASNRFLVAWQNSNPDELVEIYARRLRPNGRPQGRFHNITSSPELDKSPLLAPRQIATRRNGGDSATDGGFLLIWDRFGGTDNPHGIHARLLDARGRPEGPLERVHTAFSDDDRVLLAHFPRTLLPVRGRWYALLANNQYRNPDGTTGSRAWMGMLRPDGSPRRHERILTEDGLRGDAALSSRRVIATGWVEEGDLRHQRLRSRNLRPIKGTSQVAGNVRQLTLVSDPGSGRAFGFFTEGRTISMLVLKRNGKVDGEPMRLLEAPGVVELPHAVQLWEESRVAVAYTQRVDGRDELRLLVVDPDATPPPPS